MTYSISVIDGTVMIVTTFLYLWIGAGLPLHGKINGMANESTIDILFQLGMSQDAGTYARYYIDVKYYGNDSILYNFSKKLN